MELDIAKIEESPQLQDLLIQMEDILDSLDTYVFANWFSGKVISGPKVARHWIGMTLEYADDARPDESAALRLIKHGIDVSIERSNEGERVKTPTGKAKDKIDPIWIVELKFPRRLITDMNAGQLDFYDDEVDVEDVQDANDAGMNDETGYIEGETEDDPLAGQDMASLNASPEKGANATT